MRLLACATLFAHAVVLLTAAFLFPSPNAGQAFLAVTVGVIHAEIALLAVWVVFSMQPLRRRLLLSACGISLLAAVFCAYVIRTSGPPEVCAISTISLLLQWALIQIPFWLTKKYGWVLAKGDVGVSSRPLDVQFHLRHLFVWTAATAVLLAVGKGLLGRTGEFSPNCIEWIGFFAIVSIGHVPVASALIWGILKRNVSLIWVGFAISAIGSLPSLEGRFLSELTIGRQVLRGITTFTVVVSFVHALTIVTALLVTRGYGWRLVRSAPVQTENSVQ